MFLNVNNANFVDNLDNNGILKFSLEIVPEQGNVQTMVNDTLCCCAKDVIARLSVHLAAPRLEYI